METTMTAKLAELHKQLEAIEIEMPQTFFQQRNKNAALFEVCRQIELLENPKSYKENENHWDGHEIRL